MRYDGIIMATVSAIRDYRVGGAEADHARQAGLADAQWYTTSVPRKRLKELMRRRDGPAIRHTLIWFASIGVLGVLAFHAWGSWWAVPAFMAYGVMLTSAADSRWHEAGHGTAFKTNWMNNALYALASFLVMRNPTAWRWSHTKHHTDTAIVGLDPEIHTPRPPNIKAMLGNFIFLKGGYKSIRRMLVNASGRLTRDEETYVPESEKSKVILWGRIHLSIYLALIVWSMVIGSILPLMFVGLPIFFGAWLMILFAISQHSGLAENVLDHRLNSRTILMNPIFRFIYSNMNYHIEHHMFPMVPYHALPALHRELRADMPEPYPSLYSAFKEIVPTLLKQVKDPWYHAKRELPDTAVPLQVDQLLREVRQEENEKSGDWVEVCKAGEIDKEDVIRFDFGNRTFAVYRSVEGTYHATDGFCTHAKFHLSKGLVMGDLIECPKHNGRFEFKTGAPVRPPVCEGLKTYEVEVRGDRVMLNLGTASESPSPKSGQATAFTVVSNDNVATFIKELVLEPVDESLEFSYVPGDYVQLVIPEYRTTFETFDIQKPYRALWEQSGLFSIKAHNGKETRRNYSMATNPVRDKQLRFNVRIATPPPGSGFKPGIGSSYVFNLKPGASVKLQGPHGDFHIKETGKEMIYLGGGSGMAPLRSHISYLLESLDTRRKISFWYGARALGELFYQDYFAELARKHDNFSFHVALSDPRDGDEWSGATGFVHEYLESEYVSKHSDLTNVEFYMCGPGPMVAAAKTMLASYGVTGDQIAFDDFG